MAISASGVLFLGFLALLIAIAALVLSIIAETRALSQGPKGEKGAEGAQGATGPQGPAGTAGGPGPGGTVGSAEFNYTTQSPNNSVPPGTAFTVSTVVQNNIPLDIIPSAGAGGTVWTLTPGTYVIDFEMSLGSAGSVGVYRGATAGSLVLDGDTISGSTTATTWIHGRVNVVVATTEVVAISSVTGTAAVVTAGNAAGIYMVRVNFLKLS